MLTPAKLRVSVEGEVPFHDVDLMRIVWHGHYLKYFELGRSRLFRELGLSLATLESLPYAWVVIESKVRHTHALRLGDRFRVDAWLKDVEFRVNVAYEVHNLTTERRAARGHTILATLDQGGELLLETPAALLEYVREPGVRA